MLLQNEDYLEESPEFLSQVRERKECGLGVRSLFFQVSTD